MADPTAKPARGVLRALGLHRRELRSWALYDWANSAFATTIMAAVLPIYYASVAAGEMAGNVASAFWGYTVSASVVLIVLAMPILGAMADHMRAKKRFLAAFIGLGVLGTAALWFVREGDWSLASGLFILANIGFVGSVVFSDSLLPHIASDDEVDRVSAAGFALGYVGGGILLLVNLIMIQRPELFGFADAGIATRWAFVSVAIWWTIFSIPLFRDVPEPAGPGNEGRVAGGLGAAVRVGFGRLARTAGEIREYRELVKFLLAFWLYADGIETIIKMATVYGTEIGIDQGALIGALLLVQFIGIPFTFVFGALGDRIGAKNGIYLALGVYMLISVGGYFMQSAWHFWALAVAVGLVQGGAQSLSRSLYSTMVPRHKSSEFFSFYGVFHKSSGILGPFVFAIVGQLTGTSRLGILALVVFFVGGLILLSRVDVDAGRRVARRADARAASRRGGTSLAI